MSQNQHNLAEIISMANVCLTLHLLKKWIMLLSKVHLKHAEERATVHPALGVPLF